MFEFTKEISNLYWLLDRAWRLYLRGEETEALREITEINNKISITQEVSPKKKKKDVGLTPIQVAGRILSFEHPQIQGISDNLRQLFSLAIARSWLTSKYAKEENSHYNNVDPLALIIGTDYTFQINLDSIGKQIFGEDYKIPIGTMEYPTLPIKYGERKLYFPELVGLNNLPLAARKSFISVIQYVQVQSGFVEYDRINYYETSLLNEGVDDLVNSNLLDINPSPKDLLMQFTLNELRQFAFDRGIPSHGTKYQIAELIVKRIDHDSVNNLLFSKNTGKILLKPLVSNLPLLKRYIWAEINRINLYIEWLERVYCLKIPPKSYTEKEKLKFQKVELQNRHTKNMSILPYDPGLSDKYSYHNYLIDSRCVEERKLISDIWDEKCDDIVKVIADKFGWYVHSHDICLVCDALSEYISSEALTLFQKKFEELHSGYWKFSLVNYGSMRLYQMGIKLREPKLLTCHGCGTQFLDASVSGKIAKRVNFNINFCSSCYSKVCWHGDLADEMELPEAEMLELVKLLCQKLETIPTIQFMQAPSLEVYDGAKQIEIVKHLLKMPSYKYYEIKFGSWLKSLILSGVLEGGVRAQARGYQCIATDGHVCLSLAEKVIDDWLSAHGIKHDKEPLYPYDFYINPAGRMRGDWKVNNIIIEYAGLLDDPEYKSKIKAKQELADQLNIQVLILEPQDLLILNKKLEFLRNNQF